MDTKNSPYKSRTSINMTNMSSPIAESTHLNRSKSSSNYKFLWGGKISPAQKNSTTSNTNNKSNKISSTIKATKMHPVNKIIDPRIYTDIHSKGLTSRIVKYHEDGVKLNRSLSAGSLYNKPGQFPIVHLNKNQIQFKANRNRPASVVRIAPPDKAVFHANTRSSILRTSSIVPTVNIKKTNSDLSCENRPILHPADSDLMPTKSVLDALREISRKRINSDDLDGNDVIKKYCKEAEDISRDIRSNNGDNGNNFNSSAMKRQREIQLSPNSQLSNSASEQIIKKRMYTRNNDISSSLSSSIRMLTNPKRRLGDILNNNHSPVSENSISPKAKHHCNEHDSYEQNLQDKLNLNTLQSQPSSGMVSQITSLPTTAYMDEQSNNSQEVHQTPSKDISKVSTTISMPTMTIASKYNSTGNISQKPKLTLFNKNYDDEDFKKKLDSRRILREREEYNEKNNRVGNMKFVKPRNMSFAQLETNPIIEKMKQSRLALMLKGLKGELNEVGDEDNDNSEDETDIPQKQKPATIQSEETSTNNVSENINPPVSSTQPIVATTSASMSFATNTTASTSIITSPAIAVNPKMFPLQQEQKQIAFTDAANKDNATTTTTVSHSFGLKSNIPNSTGSVSPSSGSTSGLTTISSSNTTTTSTSGGFSFGLNVTQNSNASVGGVVTSVKSNANSATTALTSTTDNNKYAGFEFGASTNVTNSTEKTTATGFSFPTKTTIDSANVPISQTNQFNFTANDQTANLLSTQNKSKFVPVSESTIQRTSETSNQQQIIQTSIPKNYNTTSAVIFGNSPSNAQFSTVSTSAIATTSATTTVLSNQPSLFNFAGSVSSNAQEKTQNSVFGNFSNNPPLSSITATSTSLPTFGSNVTEKNNFNFSSQAANTNSTISPFGNSTKSGFAFNTTNNSADAPKTTNLFENKSPGGFKFAGVSESKSSEVNPSSTKPFTFGTAPASSVEGFSFKNSTAPAITTTVSTSSQFSFTNTNNNNQNDGASSFTPNAFPSGNQFQSSNTTFNFGAVTKPSDASKSLNFNASNQPQAMSNTTTSVFPFGGGTTSVENNPAPFSFSSNQTTATTKGFSFGNTTSQNKLDSSPASKSTVGGFSFRNPSTNTDKTSGFGTFSLTTSTAPEQQTQSNQLSNNKFSFSSNLSNNNATVNNGQNQLFGGTASLGQAKSFNFGSNTTQNVFGGLSSTTPSTTTSSMFGSVGSQLVKTTSAFTFGSSTTSLNQPQQQQQQQQTSNIPFNFGTSSNSNANTNLFASNSNTVNKPSTFNFSTTPSNNLVTSPTPAAPNMTNSTNLFLGQGNGVRQIRKATRRLNKNS